MYFEIWKYEHRSCKKYLQNIPNGITQFRTTSVKFVQILIQNISCTNCLTILYQFVIMSSTCLPLDTLYMSE